MAYEFHIQYDDELTDLLDTRVIGEMRDTETVKILGFFDPGEDIESPAYSPDTPSEMISFGIWLGHWAATTGKPVYQLYCNSSDPSATTSGIFFAGTAEDIRNYLLHQPLKREC